MWVTQHAFAFLTIFMIVCYEAYFARNLYEIFKYQNKMVEYNGVITDPQTQQNLQRDY